MSTSVVSAPASAPVAAATAVVSSAASSSALLGLALRPSRGAAGRWVLAFSFSAWSPALAFAQQWGSALGLHLRVRRVGGAFAVSVPLFAAPSSPLSLSLSVRLQGAAALPHFTRRLRGLSV
jgi:hypothetical protein